MRAYSPATSAIRRVTKPVCGGVEAYNERSLRVKYRNQGVQTSFYESTPSSQDLIGNMISPGAPESTGNARANIHDASVECDNRSASGLSRILFKHLVCKASGNRLKTTEHSHFHISLWYAHYKPIWGDSQISGTWTFRLQAPYELFGTQSGNFGPPSVG